MKRTRVPSLLFDLITHADRIRVAFEDSGSPDAFLANQTAKDATLWNFVVLGEIAQRLGDPFRDEHPQIPWRAIIAHRNIIAHGYDAVDWNMVVDVIRNHLPTLIRETKQLLSQYGPPPA